MRTLIGLVIAALLGFYVAWPAYSGYAIKNALDTDNADLLAAKIDFDSVRVSLRPAVTGEVEKWMTAAVQQGGADNAQLLGQLKTQMMPKMVEMALTTIVTPTSILRIHREGNNYKATLSKIMSEKMGSAGGGAGGLSDTLSKAGKIAEATGLAKSLGGLFGKPEPQQAPAPPAPEKTAKSPDADAKGGKPSFGLANIKSFSVSGPASYSIGIAKDQAATEPDVFADLAFTGGDWKVVGVRPRI